MPGASAAASYDGHITAGQRDLLLTHACGVVVGAMLFDVDDDELVASSSRAAIQTMTKTPPSRAPARERWPSTPARDVFGAAGRGADEMRGILVDASVYRDDSIVEQTMSNFVRRGIRPPTPRYRR